MNSVHLVTQKKKRVKTDRKWAECTEYTAQGQATRPAPRPRACRPASPAPRAPRAPTPAAARLPRARLPAAPAPVPPTAARPSALRVPAPRACARASVRLPPARSARLAQRPSSSLMGSSPFQGLQQNFFFFFIKIKKFFHLFPEIGKVNKITKIIFFYTL